MTMDELHACHGYSSTDSLLPLCRYCNPRWEDLDPTALDPEHDLFSPTSGRIGIDYSLAGRDDANHNFRDFRSPAKARKRQRERREKYFSFRGVKPGQLGRKHYVPNSSCGWWFTTLLSEAPVEVMTKERLYREAQQYPRPPQLHRAKPWEKAPYGTNNRYNGRKHALQRWEADVEDAFAPARERWIAARGEPEGGEVPGLDFGGGRYLDDSMADAYDRCRYTETRKCGCACAECHRECCEQQQRIWEEEVDAAAAEDEECDVEGEWEVLSSSAISAGNVSDDDGWDLISDATANAFETDGDGDEEEEDWIFTHAHHHHAGIAPECLPSFSSPPPQPTRNPFTTLRHFDEEGYLPYNHLHFLVDLNTGRCRACVARYLTTSRVESYARMRLSGVVAFEAGMMGMEAEETAPAGYWYSCMARPWWRQTRAEQRAAARAIGEQDEGWMMRVGCE